MTLLNHYRQGRLHRAGDVSLTELTGLTEQLTVRLHMISEYTSKVCIL